MPYIIMLQRYARLPDGKCLFVGGRDGDEFIPGPNDKFYMAELDEDPFRDKIVIEEAYAELVDPLLPYGEKEAEEDAYYEETDEGDLD